MFGYSNKIVQQDLQEMSARSIDWNKFNNKSVLVTGANAMLGTYVAYLFLYLAESKGVNVKTLVLTRSVAKTKELFKEFLDKPYFKIINQDITQQLVCDEPVDYIFHFAGNASPKFINTDPVGILQSNLIGMFNVMEFARTKNCEKVIFASTREVYGAVDANVLSENSFGYLDPMENRSCYPESKRAAESIMRSYYLQHGVKGVSVRIAHSYGPGMKIDGDGRVMADFISDAVNNRNIVLKSTGDAIRAFCYITDSVIGLVLVALNGADAEAYNLANETEPMKIRDVAALVCNASDEDIKVVFECAQSNAGYCNYPRVALDTTKIEGLGFKPSVSLADGVKRTLLSFK